MYAVIRSGGKQYRVAVGDRLRVETLRAEPGEAITLDEVLITADGDEVAVGNPLLETTVQATVVGHGRGKKVRIFKMRRRKNSRLHAGHRQNFTELEITGIGGQVATTDEAPATEPETAAESVTTDATQAEASHDGT